MPRSQNDTPVPAEERPSVPFSPSDLAIPIVICIVVGVLIFLAFQPEKLSPISATNLSIAKEPLNSLEKQMRSAAVASELINRNDVSLETADACLTRLAALRHQDTADVCLETIQQLPEGLSLRVQRRWAALLLKHANTELIDDLVADQSRDRPVAARIGWAVAIMISPDDASSLFERAALNTQHMMQLTQAIPIIADPEISTLCFTEIQKWIITPVCQYPEAIDGPLLGATIESVAEMQIGKSQKVSTFCKLALAGANRANCFRNLQQLGAEAIPENLRGHIAAALLEHLANRVRNPHTICCPTTWRFAESLGNVFSGRKQERYQSRLLEIRGETSSRLAVTSP